MPDAQVYLYGQILMTHSLLRQDGMPPRDGYGELAARYRLIGGETGVGVAVLASGLQRADGGHLDGAAYPGRCFCLFCRQTGGSEPAHL